MKNQQAHSFSVIATDRVSIWEWKDQVKVSFYESAENYVEVCGVDTKEFLLACSYFISALANSTKDLSSDNQRLLNDMFNSLEIMKNNQTPKVSA